MRWVTYATDRVGVIGEHRIHPVAPGVSWVELIGWGAEELRVTGEAALASAAQTVLLAEARLGAPIACPPSVRNCLCFLDHMRNCREPDPAAAPDLDQMTLMAMMAGRALS
ncbi:hypothetical protein [Nonomuraea sp. B19D2]|uniref:hypothetical protein n=1 Tax=Nonomuraea sp. B19D2 TaxID=3159561 RepID=UPI0032D9D101